MAPAAGESTQTYTRGIHTTEPHKPILPLYLQEKDLPTEQTRGLDICKAIAQQLGNPTLLKMVQPRKINQNDTLWRLHVTTDKAREQMLGEGLQYQNTTVPLLDQNPHIFGSGENTRTKVTIKDLPASVSEEQVITMLQNYNHTKPTRIMHSCYRDENGRLTPWENGDLYLYLEKEDLKTNNIPRTIQVGSFKCRVYYDGQYPPKQDINTCKTCKSDKHKTGSPMCKNYKINSDVRTFYGKEDMLSNMNATQFIYEDILFQSSEQCYQYNKAIRCGRSDLADQIMRTPNPFAAKKIGKKIETDKMWDELNTELMRNIQYAKFQTPEAKTVLIETGRKTLAEANPYDQRWGTGLTEEETLLVKRTAWPGLNRMGEILMKVRSDLQLSDKLADPKVLIDNNDNMQNTEKSMVDLSEKAIQPENQKTSPTETNPTTDLQCQYTNTDNTETETQNEQQRQAQIPGIRRGKRFRSGEMHERKKRPRRRTKEGKDATKTNIEGAITRFLIRSKEKSYNQSNETSCDTSDIGSDNHYEASDEGADAEPPDPFASK